MRALLLLALGAPGLAAADTAASPEPVLVVMRPYYAAPELGDTGLIGMWATNSVNKTSANKVDTFNERLADADFPRKARAVFGCFAKPGPCDRGEAFGDQAQFEAAVRSHPSQEGYLVEVVPELGANQVMIRADAYRVKITGDVQKSLIRTGDGYHAFATWRAPPAILQTKKKAKRTSPELDAWWTSGEPRRINDMAARGLVELNYLLDLLVNKSKAGYWSDGRPVVNAWDFPDKKRLNCRGKQLCQLNYVLEDRGDGFVLVQGGNYAGWFDPSAAAYQGTVGIVTFGVY